ncbi:protein of unknown function [Pseudomonas sp. JV551A1]|uniref:Uncharacterized protein n=1 Tax=Pseudomonas inefficax TaxID=2078786 RepID=A0AAQ1PCG8_9PSED|nr:protein of unknown function [Pseudomonas sp. JV551A1]SPO61717.1 protein of unknown function [Pseudomonas inefficax]
MTAPSDRNPANWRGFLMKRHCKTVIRDWQLSTHSRRCVLQRTLWERVHPRTPAQPVPSTAAPASRVNPLPQSACRTHEAGYSQVSASGRMLPFAVYSQGPLTAIRELTAINPKRSSVTGALRGPSPASAALTGTAHV